MTSVISGRLDNALGCEAGTHGGFAAIDAAFRRAGHATLEFDLLEVGKPGSVAALKLALPKLWNEAGE
jgi:hypothetical protein